MVAAGPWDIMSSGLPAIVAPGGFPGQRNSAGCGRADSYCCQLCWVSSSNERTGRDGERFEPRSWAIPADIGVGRSWMAENNSPAT